MTLLDPQTWSLTHATSGTANFRFRHPAIKHGVLKSVRCLKVTDASGSDALQSISGVLLSDSTKRHGS